MYGVYPSSLFKAITPSDTVAVQYGTSASSPSSALAPRGLYIGGAGNLYVKDFNGVTTAFMALPVGTFLPIAPQFILNTSTTATNIVAVF